jgi:hypothetical protein
MNIAVRTLCAGTLALLSFVVESGQGRFDTVAAAATIYRCKSADGLVFSDRPCGADAAVHETAGSPVTVYDALPISKRASAPQSKVKTAARSAGKGATAAARHQATCARLDQSLRELRTRLRTGYGVKEGERLKARQHQLAERRRTEKCR